LIEVFGAGIARFRHIRQWSRKFENPHVYVHNNDHSSSLHEKGNVNAACVEELILENQ
jgi:hypothetical protein